MKQTTLAMAWGGQKPVAMPSGFSAISGARQVASAPSTSTTAAVSAGAESTFPTDISQLDFRANAKLPLALRASKNDSNTLEGFDASGEGAVWVYPVNFPVREYQYNIVASALAKNTLVCLPTGLGKTFIAAVVMMNFYRWYPAGRVVFMAPTKPLVAQQIDACYGIAGVPAADTIEMTGCMPPAARRAAWQDKRLFFCTPQVFANDLTNQLCDPAQVRCVVIDEAHKATGNHAYCVAIRTLASRHNQFRVLALSATPGSDVRSVQEVINNLLISHIELRTEQCRDIQRYSHERNVEKIVVPLGPEVEAAVRRLEAIIDVYVSRLKQNKAVYASVRVATLSKYALIMQRQEFFQRYGGSIPPDRQSFIHRNFAMAISLYHGYEIVQQHGLRPLYNFLKGVLEGERGSNSTRLELQRQPAFAELWDSLLDKFKPDPNSTLSSTQAAFVGGHPKLSRLLEIVLEHFQSTEDPAERQRTRVIIFSQYRDSVTEIARMLKQHRPLVRCMTFFGQASTGKNSKGLTQKDQLRVMQEFRQGAYNTLVSTCVGEEGLDIGQVDLIICYDAQKSPVRLIQRMGRTGRARQGRIVMLLAAGKEEASYGASLSKRASVNKVILDGFRKLQFYSDTPRMIPTGLQPTVSLRRLDIQQRPAAGGAARKRRAVGSSVADGGGGCSSAKLRPDQVLDYETRLASSAPTFARLLPPRLRCLPSTLAETEDDLRQHRHPQQQMPLDHCRRPSRFASNGPAGGASVTRHHLVALGRLLGCHRAGATNLMFHAVGLRDLEDANLTAVATQTARLLLADDDLDEDFADDDDVPIPIDDDLDCPRMFDDSAEEQLLMPPPAAQPRLPAEMPLLSTQTLFRGAAAAADAEAPAENANDLQTDGAPISPVFRSSAAVRRHRLSSQAAASAASIAAAEPTMSLAEATSSRRPLYSLRPFQPATAAELESLQSAIQCLLSADEPDDVGEIVDQLAEEWRSERSRLLPTLLLKSKPAAADCDSNWQLLDGAENWSVDDLFASAEDQKPPPEDLVVLASQRPTKFGSVFQSLPRCSQKRVSFAIADLGSLEEQRPVQKNKDPEEQRPAQQNKDLEEQRPAQQNKDLEEQRPVQPVSSTENATPRTIGRIGSLGFTVSANKDYSRDLDKDLEKQVAFVVVPSATDNDNKDQLDAESAVPKTAAASTPKASRECERGVLFKPDKDLNIATPSQSIGTIGWVNKNHNCDIKATKTTAVCASPMPPVQNTPICKDSNKDSKLFDSAARRRGRIFSKIFQLMPVATPEAPTPLARRPLTAWSVAEPAAARAAAARNADNQLDFSAALRLLEATDDSEQSSNLPAAVPSSVTADMFRIETDLFQPVEPSAEASPVFDKLGASSQKLMKQLPPATPPKCNGTNDDKANKIDDDEDLLMLDTSWLAELTQPLNSPVLPKQSLEKKKRNANDKPAAAAAAGEINKDCDDDFLRPLPPPPPNPATPTRHARLSRASPSRPMKRKSTSPTRPGSPELNASASSASASSFLALQKKILAKKKQKPKSLSKSQARSLSLAAALPASGEREERPQRDPRPKRPRRHRGGGCDFLDDEAALTDSDADFVSSDEASDAADSDAGSSFVDDATQQEAETSAVAAAGGMRAIYLRSLATAQQSPARRFKIPSLADRPFNPAEVFSQLPRAGVPESPESEYQFDSFLVPNEQAVSPAAATAKSPLSAAIALGKRRAKAAVNNTTKSSKQQQAKQQRRRLVVIQEDTQFCADDADNSSDDFQ
ncbi:hypothetical protein BOX15_Mlig026302g1 [Macrostomum lignano]|uniref:Fanconi anemia group M protein n=1 Tax=Macrostomum lignano TaxID=282301 RepID=A0A267FJT4_9PLAT|nr:hypothetical protein BOX15_Mlig026302g1 [Macrostomum lignano]